MYLCVGVVGGRQCTFPFSSCNNLILEMFLTLKHFEQDHYNKDEEGKKVVRR